MADFDYTTLTTDNSSSSQYTSVSKAVSKNNETLRNLMSGEASFTKDSWQKDNWQKDSYQKDSYQVDNYKETFNNEVAAVQ